MRVIKIYDDVVAKCLLDNPFEYAMAWKVEKQHLAVCLTENLEPELTLFNGDENE